MSFANHAKDLALALNDMESKPAPVKVWNKTILVTKHFMARTEARTLFGGNPENIPIILSQILQSSVTVRDTKNENLNDAHFIWDNQWVLVAGKTKRKFIFVTFFHFSGWRNRYCPIPNPYIRQS